MKTIPTGLRSKLYIGEGLTQYWDKHPRCVKARAPWNVGLEQIFSGNWDVQIVRFRRSVAGYWRIS